MSASTGDTMLQARGFKVEIGGSDEDADINWDSVDGGMLNIEVVETTIGGDQCHTTTPGHKYLDEITLRGPMTAGRKALCQWITETTSGKPWKRTLTITELVSAGGGGSGKTYTYQDCFPVRYCYPRLSTSGPSEMEEEVTILCEWGEAR